MTTHTCGSFHCKSYCFTGNNTRGNKKTCQILTCSVLVHPSINLLALLDVNHVQAEENWATYSRASSAKQCIHRNSDWTGPVTYTLQGHAWAALGHSPVPLSPPHTAARGCGQPGWWPCRSRGWTPAHRHYTFRPGQRKPPST